jgi:hypothetical protein
MLIALCEINPRDIYTLHVLYHYPKIEIGAKMADASVSSDAP